MLCEQAKTTSRKEENVDNDIDDPFIGNNRAINSAESSNFSKDNSSSSSSIKTAQSSTSFDNKSQDLDSISPGPEESETESIDIDQGEEEIRKLT